MVLDRPLQYLHVTSSTNNKHIWGAKFIWFKDVVISNGIYTYLKIMGGYFYDKAGFYRENTINVLLDKPRKLLHWKNDNGIL